MTSGINDMKTSDKILTLLGIFYFWFVCVMIVLFLEKGAVPDTLIQCTMGGGVIEAIALAAIKVSKIFKKGDKETDGTDCEESGGSTER